MPEVDVAKGSRFMHPESLHQMPSFRKWGNRGVSFVMQLALGYWGMSDVLHGYFLARTDVMRQMNIDAIADGYDLENTMMAEFRRLRATFALIPSPSRYGEEVSKIVDKKQIPRTIKTVSGMVAQRVVHRARPPRPRAPRPLGPDPRRNAPAWPRCACADQPEGQEAPVARTTIPR